MSQIWRVIKGGKYSEQKNWLTKGQITAQGTKVNSWKIVITKLGIMSFVVPNNKHLDLFVDLILTLEQSPLSQSAFLLTPFWPKSYDITWLNLKYYVIWPSTVYETLSVQLQPPQMCLVKNSEKAYFAPKRQILLSDDLSDEYHPLYSHRASLQY